MKRRMWILIAFVVLVPIYLFVYVLSNIQLLYDTVAAMFKPGRVE